MTTIRQNPHQWFLSDLSEVPKNNLNVFSTFSCGGGSSMGYKRAGYTVVGANDIDPDMRYHYELNLKPPLYIQAPIKDLVTMDLPDNLFDLDILDGSPPCSTFSLAGNREKDWGREKFFREGQAAQVLDDLFFDYLDVVARLKPRVAIAENVKGMILGSAKGYVRLIMARLKEIGYTAQVFLLNAAYCGVPQARERVFVVAFRNDMKFQPLTLTPFEKALTIKESLAGITYDSSGMSPLSKMRNELWFNTEPGRNFTDARRKMANKDGWFNHVRLNVNKPSNTMPACSMLYHWNEPRMLCKEEMIAISSFPSDYQFNSVKMAEYLMGMSVPPKMMEFVAKNVAEQWLQHKPKPT
jgi:DNA (cytosine-5)-methyltransferase 1